MLQQTAKEKVVVYTAESQAFQIRNVFRQMVNGVYHGHYIAWRLFLREIHSDYAKSAVGLLWDFLDPLVFAVIFYLLTISRVLSPGNMGMPVPVFMIYGLLLYQTFSESVLMSVESIRRSGNLINQLKVPPEAIIMAVFLRQMFHACFRVPVMLLVSLVCLNAAHQTGVDALSVTGFLKFLFLYPVFVLTGMSVGIFLAPFHTLYNDVGRLTRLILLPLRYLSPVLWQLPENRLFDLISSLNPVHLSLMNLRTLAVSDAWVSPEVWALWLAGFAILFLLGWTLYHISIPVLAERT